MPSLVVPESERPSAPPSGTVADLVPAAACACRLSPHKRKRVRSVVVDDEIVAYASPDSTFAVTKRLLDGARRSILIGVYDFTADHVKQLVHAALLRGVTVELMLDLDGAAERQIYDDLARFGAICTPAPSCASGRAHYFRCSHQNVIVIDNEWTLVQSGNWSAHSVPLNLRDDGDAEGFTTGNRDMGLAVRSRRLAARFRQILQSDIQLELRGPSVAHELKAAAETLLVEAAPRRSPERIFPSRAFALARPVTVAPVLSPDNYMSFVPRLLAQARKSILIEQQCIRATQCQVARLLAAVKRARDERPSLDVRVVLGKVFGPAELASERYNLKELKARYGLELGRNVRYIDSDRFLHCHNKLLLIDGKGVLVGSQSWSNAALAENREASLWLEHRGVAAYFSQIFDSDWKTAQHDPGSRLPTSVPEAALKSGRFVRVMAGDYV
jgi:phosphatidylserine/phosphatidylglycerophosphate/cardiolipin synthase-like enzyme